MLYLPPDHLTAQVIRLENKSYSAENQLKFIYIGGDDGGSTTEGLESINSFADSLSWTMNHNMESDQKEFWAQSY